MIARVIVSALVCGCGVRPPAPPAANAGQRVASPVLKPPTGARSTVRQFPTRPIPGVHARVSGTVTDVFTHEPIPGVIIMLSSDAHEELLSAISDADGAYVFADVDPGAYRLTVMFGGTTYDTSVEARGGFEIVVNCRLDQTGMGSRPEPLFVDPPVSVIPAQLDAR